MCKPRTLTSGARKRPNLARLSESAVSFQIGFSRTWGARNRPCPAHLSEILFSFHFGFSAASENLRRRIVVPGQRPTTRAGSGALLPETRSFDGKFDAVGAPSAERGRSEQACVDLQKLRRKKPERPPKNEQPNKSTRPRNNRYAVRTDSGPIALRSR